MARNVIACIGIGCLPSSIAEYSSGYRKKNESPYNRTEHCGQVALIRESTWLPSMYATMVERHFASGQDYAHAMPYCRLAEGIRGSVGCTTCSAHL